MMYYSTIIKLGFSVAILALTFLDSHLIDPKHPEFVAPHHVCSFHELF
jgi:hypothetical protein